MGLILTLPVFRDLKSRCHRAFLNGEYILSTPNQQFGRIENARELAASFHG